MSALWLWAILVGAFALLIVLRPGWTWGALLVGGMLVGGQLGASPLVPLVAVAGGWLLWQLSRLTR